MFELEGLHVSVSKELVSWDEAVRRCKTFSDEPLYLPGFSDDQFQEADEYMNKHEITSLWINLKYSPVFVWNNGTVYSKLPQSSLNITFKIIKSCLTVWHHGLSKTR